MNRSWNLSRFEELVEAGPESVTVNQRARTQAVGASTGPHTQGQRSMRTSSPLSSRHHHHRLLPRDAMLIDTTHDLTSCCGPVTRVERFPPGITTKGAERSTLPLSENMPVMMATEEQEEPR